MDQSAEVEKASNLCQPRIKVDILQIFHLFHTAPVKAVQMGEGLLYHMLPQSTHWRWLKVTLITIKVKSHPDRRDEGEGCYIIGPDAHKQTAPLGRRCTNGVTHHQKYKFMLKINTKVARKWILPYHKMHKLAPNGLFLGSRATLLAVLFCAHTPVTSY